MKKIYLLASLAFTMNAFAQDANVYVSNLSSNCGYATYTNSNTTISGIFFEILSDGDNSNNVIPDFQTSLYLLSCDNSGNPTSGTPIVIKTYQISGMQQLHALDYSNESVDLSQVSGLSDGMYRMGVWVNSDYGVASPPDDHSDNATLIQSNSGTPSGSVINFTSSTGITKIANINDQVRVYPNPAAADLNISFSNGGNEASIHLFDISGKLVLSQTINGVTHINTGSLSEGVYNMNIATKEGVANKRIVIVK